MKIKDIRVGMRLKLKPEISFKEWPSVYRQHFNSNMYYVVSAVVSHGWEFMACSNRDCSSGGRCHGNWGSSEYWESDSTPDSCLVEVPTSQEILQARSLPSPEEALAFFRRKP